MEKKTEGVLTLFAVQEYAASVVNGVTSPNWVRPLDAKVVVPVPGLATLAQPFLFLWGATANESRTSIPRSAPGINPTLVTPGDSVPSGWKQRAYMITMWLYGVQNNSDPHRDSKFPVLIEQVLDALRMTQVPVYLTDSVTGEQSKLMNIGEEFAWDYDVDRTLADQRLVRNEAQINVSVLEMFQF